MVSETVREKLFLALGEELPYSTAVTVEAWDETSQPGLIKIRASILVTRESHKPMMDWRKNRLQDSMSSAGPVGSTRTA